MKHKWLLIITIFLLSFTACSSAKSYSAEAPMEFAAEDSIAAPSYSNDIIEYEKQEYMESNSNLDTGGGYQQSTVERIVIMNASITIVVDDPAAAMQEVADLAEEMNGFIVKSNLYKTYTGSGLEVPEATISIRVPSDQLNKAMENIKSLVNDQAQDITAENISGEDVTSEYTDLQSRLRNLEDARDQLQTIMDEAYKTEDVLSVYRELTQITEQIEIIKGQIKYYDEASKLSSISVTILAKESVEPLSVGSWEPKGIARDAIQALINAMKFFTTAAIWFVLFLLPVIIVAAIPFVILFFIIRYFWQKRKKNKDSKTQVIEKTE